MHPICPYLTPGEPITQIGLYDGSGFGARARKLDRESKHCRLSVQTMLYLLTILTRYVLIRFAFPRYLFRLCCPVKITGLGKTAQDATNVRNFKHLINS